MDVSVMLELGSGISLPYSIRSKQWKPLYILAEKGHLYSCHFFSYRVLPPVTMRRF